MVTINDIAREANVSKATVSRVINNKSGVRPAIRKRILELMKKYNYHPNALAQAITAKESKSVGLIFPYSEDYILSNPIYSEILLGLTTYLTKNNYYSILCFSNSPEYISSLYLQMRVDGYILVSPASTHANIVETLQIIEAPFVITCDYVSPNQSFPVFCVDTDNFAAATLAMNHLLEHGHKRIALLTVSSDISEKSYSAPFLIREDAYHQALSEAGIQFDENLIIRASAISMDDGYKAMSQFIQQAPADFTAIFCAADVLAVGALSALHNHGINVPKDVSIISFDGIPLSKYTTPSLTTIRQNAYMRGKIAAEILLDYIKNGTEMRSVYIDFILAMGNSVKMLK